MPPQTTEKWVKKNDVIYFTVGPTDGTTGPEWVKRHEKNGCYLDRLPRKIMESPGFVTTTGVTYLVAVLCGSMFSRGRIHNQRIEDAAKKREFLSPPHELACLISEKFSDDEIKAMGLHWIIVANGPIGDEHAWMGPLIAIGSPGDPDPYHLGIGYRQIATVFDPDEGYSITDGFAFVKSIE